MGEKQLIMIIIVLIAMILLAQCNNAETLHDPLRQTGIYEGIPITPRPYEDGMCWDSTQVFGSPRTWEEVKQSRPMQASSGSRVLHGMGYDDVSIATYENGVYYVPADTPFDLTYHMLYLNGTEPEVEQVARHMVLLNEQQLNSSINGESGNFYDVRLQSEDESNLTIAVPPLTNGVNELTILTLINPIDGNTFSPEFYGYRITLLAEEPKPVMLRSYTLLPREDHDVSVSINLSLGERLKDWNWPEETINIEQGTTFDYWIEVGYLYVINANAPDLPPPRTARFAIITFLDFEQVSVLPDTPVYYGEVTSGTQVAQINATLPTLATLGRHHIMVVRIDNPGIPSCLLQGPPDGYFLSKGIYADVAWIDVQ